MLELNEVRRIAPEPFRMRGGMIGEEETRVSQKAELGA